VIGVAVTHVLSPRYTQLFGDRVHHHFHEVPRFNPAGLTAWFVGAGVGLLMTLTDTGAAYAPVVTLALSVACYAGFLSVAKRQWFLVSA